MGQKTSVLKVKAVAEVPAGRPVVDTLTLSYSTRGCWGRGRRRLARFTFPHRGWVSSLGPQVCRAKEQPLLPLAKLQKKDASTIIKVKCTFRGAPVLAATMPLARLLALGEGTAGGDAALLSFKLAGGENMAVQRGAAYTALSCNGRLCGNGGSAGGNGGQGDAECLSHREGGWGTPASPGQQQLRGDEETLGPAQPKATEGQQCPGRAGHREGDDLPAQRGGPAAALTHRQLTAVELWCPVWKTPTRAKDSGTNTRPHSPSTPAFPAEPQPAVITLPDCAQTFTVPRVYRKDPSASAQDPAVPEVDLGESSTLALYYALNRTEPQPYVGQDSSPPVMDFGESVSLEFYEPAPFVEIPLCSEHDDEPEPCVRQDSSPQVIDFGESVSLEIYDPSPFVPELEPAPPQEQWPLGIGSPWVDALMNGMVFFLPLTVLTFLLLFEDRLQSWAWQ
ncbi:uncharacterized protein LOC126985835 isoform X2 [Eriocheir sinensis]|uniref:uncharacterized protein LOC126985835 isoform X2 n=1 Tax=Eriocheir sinensis TaxID=95602 RepID=UPI0021C737E4|nr:uncharacterized protein LOC126985835 isoform X2 [Eriocheir sinensis]